MLGSVVIAFFNGNFHSSYIFTGDNNVARAEAYLKQLRLQELELGVADWLLETPHEKELCATFHRSDMKNISDEFVEDCWETFKKYLDYDFVLDMFAIVVEDTK